MDIKLPKLGEGAESGVVVSLLVREGDEVKAGQTILELENEKAVAPVPSTASGRVTRIRVKEGDRVTVGQVLMSVGGEEPPVSRVAAEEPAAAKRPARAAAVAAPAPVAVEAEAVAVEEDTEEFLQAEEAVVASPGVRRVAADLGIDLRRVRGSDKGGRITTADLRAYVQQLIQATRRRRETPVASAAPSAAPARAVAESIDFSKWGPVQAKPLSSLRKVISQRMTENWNTIPHVTQFDEADVTALVELRKREAPAFEAQGTRLTLTTFVLKALVETLKKHPLFNASLDEAAGQVVFKDYYHIGIAVDTEAGLIVPVIRDADKKDLVQLSKDLNNLAAKARERKVSLEDLKGGTFSVSNQGGIGGGHFTPIVNKPEVAILGLGRSVVKPVVREGRIEPRTMLPLALSYDHRLIDGGSAARFITDLVRALETFPGVG